MIILTVILNYIYLIVFTINIFQQLYWNLFVGNHKFKIIAFRIHFDIVFSFLLFYELFKGDFLFVQNLNKDMLIADDQNQCVEALTVFAHSIRFIKNDLQKQLTKTGYDIDDVEIQWVITIPAIWNPRSKQFMRVAAHKVQQFCDAVYGNHIKRWVN